MLSYEKSVVVSDLHLGDPASILTADPARLDELADRICAEGPFTELVLLGDLMEFALAPMADAYGLTRRFFARLLAGDAPFRRMVLVPGNHDHHLWIAQVEWAEVAPGLYRDGSAPDKAGWPRLLVDRRYPFGDKDVLFRGLLPDDRRMFDLVIKFPHHLVMGTGGQAVFYTHGHFFEPVHVPISTLIEKTHPVIDGQAVADTTLEDLESYNYWWQEALWYHLGQSGDLVDVVRQAFVGTDHGDRKTLQTLLDIGTKAIIGVDFPGFVDHLVAGFLARRVRASRLRNQAYSAELAEQIREIMQKFVLVRYLVKEHREGEPSMPTPFTIVFGHTHRYFVGERIELEHPVASRREAYPLHNTGGWLEDADNAGYLVLDGRGATSARWVSF